MFSVLFVQNHLRMVVLFVLVAVRERAPFYSDIRREARVPATEAKTKIVIPERRPLFEERILEERRPFTRRDVTDDWYILLDVDLKESGIFIGCDSLFSFRCSAHSQPFFDFLERKLTLGRTFAALL